ncbi:MAG: hypothetical protein WCT04_23685 [Planctomycetota bacterium]
MTAISSMTSFKRRDIKGQLQMDFGDDILPPPSLVRPITTANATPRDRDVVVPSLELASFSFNESAPESNSAKVDSAPSYTFSGKRSAEPIPAFPAEIHRLADSLEGSAPSYFVTDARAMELIEQAAREVRPGEVQGVKVRFLPFRATLYSFKMDRVRTAAVKFHVAFRRASDDVILQAARLMLCRARRLRQTLPRAEYDAFVRSLPMADFKLPGARRARRASFGAQGIHRHLEESFKRINETYFASHMKQPELCWSPVRARRILGSYQERNDRLIVSRVFDNPAVPLFVLDFLMYHELLHKFLGVGRRGDGRRCMHGPEFKELERKFARFEEAQECIKRL